MIDPVVVQQNLDKLATGLVEFLPGAIGATVLFIVGIVVGSILARLSRKLMQVLRFEEFLTAHDIHDSLGKIKVSTVVERVVKYYIILVFLNASVSMLNLPVLVNFLNMILVYAPVLIGAVLFVTFAAIIGELVRDELINYDKKSKSLWYVGGVLKVVIVFLGVMVGLDTIGFEMTLVNRTFEIILQGLVWGVAAAFALAFGLGGQSHAKDIIKDFRDHYKV